MRKTSVYYRFYNQRINDLGLNKQVTFTGFRKDIPEFVAGLDVIVVPSEGLSLLEG